VTGVQTCALPIFSNALVKLQQLIKAQKESKGLKQ
jgi:hypothetical protein